ncbi:carbohydrate ABC transporter permease [Paenibacillus castaneae]|uniref:carbohydrate ABC transporter permease n=1 Tax=Paenibacillus castaneae TaxID=474957 RepID=UPI000C99BBDF|nr:carbohydrate ABC transporter permease [Paenibacillus castaneae]
MYMNVKARSRSDILFDIFNYGLLTIVLLIVLYPLYFVVIASFSNPTLVNSGQVTLIPKGINFEGYVRIFNDKMILTGYGNSLLYTALGTLISVAITIPGAYALSRRELAGRNLVMYMIVFTMFFNGGLIPTFILVKNLGLYNSFWSLILPVAVIPWNLIIARTFFQTSIPDELREAAQIDGCNEFRFFFRIALPLSSALIAIMVLFYAVGYWNTYFSALIYLKDETLYPLQLVLRNILIANTISPDMMENVEQASKQLEIASLIQYGVIIVAAFPLLILYPFLQRYFVKGVLVGSIKG